MIRPVAEDDVPMLAILEELLFPGNSMGEQLLRSELRHGGGLIAGSFQGYALYREDGPLIDITRLGVLPTCRRQGIGTRLLEEILAQKKDTMLTVDVDNPLALALYLGRGFHIVGRAALAPAWVMRRPATGSSSCTPPRSPRTEGSESHQLG